MSLTPPFGPTKSPTSTLRKGAPNDKSHRLYLHYRPENLSSPKKKLSGICTSGCIIRYTYGLPSKVVICPSTQSIKSVLKDFNVNSGLNIIIEGGSYKDLDKLSKLYTSVEYWNTFSYIENMSRLVHMYPKKTIKQALYENNGEIITLVLGFWPFETTYSRVEALYEHPKCDPKYTLHVKFKKSDFYKSSPISGISRFSFSGSAAYTAIWRGSTRLQHHRDKHCVGSTVEFNIIGDDLGQLMQIRNDLRNTNIPNEKCKCTAFGINVESGCIQLVENTQKVEKYKVSLGRKESFLYPCIKYGRSVFDIW